MSTRSTDTRATKAAEARQNAEADEAKDGPEETPTAIAEPEVPNLPQTVHDPVSGVDRIIVPAGPAWEPAPTEPDPEEVARMEAFNARLEERQKDQLGDVEETKAETKTKDA